MDSEAQRLADAAAGATRAQHPFGKVAATGKTCHKRNRLKQFAKPHPARRNNARTPQNLWVVGAQIG